MTSPIIAIGVFKFVAAAHVLQNNASTQEVEVADPAAIRMWRRRYRRLGKKVKARRAQGSQESAYWKQRPLFRGGRRTKLIYTKFFFRLGNWRHEALYDEVSLEKQNAEE